MLLTRKHTNLIGNRSMLFCGIMFVAVITLLPGAGRAQCTRWNAGIIHNIAQSGVKTKFLMQLKQKGNLLTGTAAIQEEKNLFEKWKALDGTAEGTIVGSDFRVQVFWENGKTGVYNGTVSPSGILEGTAYEKATPNYLHSWHGKARLECLPAPVAPPVKLTPIKLPADTLKPKPIKSSGKPKPAKTEPPPPMKVPGIIATQAIFSDPSAIAGFAVITWDAGSEHPYAEVWYRVNNGAEAFLVEQGKGSRQVPVERYKNYTYILIDAGKTLATINVAGN